MNRSRYILPERSGQALVADQRLYTRHEETADAVVHIIGILFAINASLWLLWHVTGMSVVVSVLIYCIGLLAMIGCSAAYNMMPTSRPSKIILRRLDHAAIFIMIAGTYTPFAVNRLSEPSGAIVLSAVWVCAAFGVVMKLIWPRRFEWLSLGLYLAMGWVIVTVIQPLSVSLAHSRQFLAVDGGLHRLFGGCGLLRLGACPLSLRDLARLCSGSRYVAIWLDLGRDRAALA